MYSRVLLISIPSQRKGELSPHLARARDCLAVSTVDQENTVVWALQYNSFTFLYAPVLCKLLVKLRKLKKPQLQTKFNIMKLKSDKELKDQFVIEVKNRFDGLVELTEAEELFEKNERIT